MKTKNSVSILFLVFIFFISTLAPMTARAAEAVPFEKYKNLEGFYSSWYRNVIWKSDYIKFSWKIDEVRQDTDTKTILLFLSGLGAEKPIGGFDGCSCIFRIHGASLTPKFLQNASITISDGEFADTCNVVLKSGGQVVKATLHVTFEGPMPALSENPKKK